MDPEKSADLTMAVGPSKYPLRIAQIPPPSPAEIAGSTALPIIPPPVDITPARLASVKIAPEISAPVNMAFVKFAFERLALEIEIPFNEIPVRFANRRFVPGPTIYIFRIVQFDGSNANPELYNSPVIKFVRLVVDVIIVPLTSDPKMFTPDKSTPVRFASTRDTRGPTMNPPRIAYAAFGIVAPAPAVAFNRPPLRILVTIAPEKFAPEISQPLMLRPVRSVLDKFALTRRKFGPTI